MKIKETIIMKKIIADTAKKDGVSYFTARKEIKATINMLWYSGALNGYQFKTKPSPEEFIYIISCKLLNK